MAEGIENELRGNGLYRAVLIGALSLSGVGYISKDDSDRYYRAEAEKDHAAIYSKIEDGEQDYKTLSERVQNIYDSRPPDLLSVIKDLEGRLRALELEVAGLESK